MRGKRILLSMLALALMAGTGPRETWAGDAYLARSVQCSLPPYQGTLWITQTAPYQDLSGDGVDDFLAGIYASGEFEVAFFNGITGNPLRVVKAPGTRGTMLASTRLADLNHDGFEEVLLWADSPSTMSLLVYSPSDDTSRTIVSPLPSNEYPRTEFTGDITGDGTADIAVPFPSLALEGNPAASGYVSFYSGNDNALLQTIGPPEPLANARFGSLVSPIDDVTSDGIADVLILESRLTPRTPAGRDRIHVYSGATLEPVTFFPCPVSYAVFGGSSGVSALQLGGAPDLNGDSIPDLYTTYAAVQGDSVRTAIYLLSGADGSELRHWLFTDPCLQIVAGFLPPGPDPTPGILFSSTPVNLLTPSSVSATLIHLGPSQDTALPIAEYSSAYYLSTSVVRDQTGDGRPDIVMAPLLAGTPPVLRYDVYSLTPKIRYWPDQLDFGIRDPSHGPSHMLYVSVWNEGTTLFFTGPGVEIVGPDRSDFALVDPDTSPLPKFRSVPWVGGNDRHFNIYFDPSTLGDKAAEVVFTTTDPTSPTVRVALHGTGATVSAVDRGVFVAAGYQGLFEIDPHTGNRRVVASTQAGSGPYFDGVMGLLSFEPNRLLVSTAETGRSNPSSAVYWNYLMYVEVASGNHAYHPAEQNYVPIQFRFNEAAFQGLAWDPATDGILVANLQGGYCPGNLSSRILRYDPATTGTAIVVSSLYEGVGQGPGFCDPWDLDVTRDGTVIVTDKDLGLFRVNPVTGDRERFLPFTVTSDLTSTYPLSTAIDPDDRIYTVLKNLAAVYRVEPESAGLQVASGAGVGEGPGFVRPTAIAFDPLDGQMMVYDSGLCALFRVDPRTGNRTVLSCSTDPYRRGEGTDLPAAGHCLAVSTRLSFQGRGIYSH